MMKRGLEWPLAECGRSTNRRKRAKHILLARATSTDEHARKQTLLTVAEYMYACLTYSKEHELKYTALNASMFLVHNVPQSTIFITTDHIIYCHECSLLITDHAGGGSMDLPHTRL